MKQRIGERLSGKRVSRFSGLPLDQTWDPPLTSNLSIWDSVRSSVGLKGPSCGCPLGEGTEETENMVHLSQQAWADLLSGTPVVTFTSHLS